MELLKHPQSVNSLVAELKKAIDMYWKKELSEAKLKELLHCWSTDERDKLFKDNDINPTLRVRAGQKRVEVVEKFLREMKTK